MKRDVVFEMTLDTVARCGHKMTSVNALLTKGDEGKESL